MGETLVLREVGTELEEVDAQLAGHDEVHRQAAELMHLLGDLLHLVLRQVAGDGEGVDIGVVDKVHGLAKPGLRVDALANDTGRLGGGGHDREHAGVVVVVARQHHGVVQDGGLLHHAVHAYAALAQQAIDHRCAGGAVGLAVKVVRTVPSIVLVEPGDDGARHGVAVTVDAPDLLGVVAGRHMRVAGARGIDEHQVRDLQQGIGVVLYRAGVGQVLGAIGGHAHRALAADAHHRRGSARAAVPKERDGAVGLVLLVRDIGEAELMAHGLAFVAIDGEHLCGARIIDGLAVLARPGIVLGRGLRNLFLRFLWGLGCAGFCHRCPSPAAKSRHDVVLKGLFPCASTLARSKAHLDSISTDVH